MTPQFQELEADNCRLRAALTDLRKEFLEYVTKFGRIAAVTGFPGDESIENIERHLDAKMGRAPALDQATLTAAAKWLEDDWILASGEFGLPPVTKDENSWTQYAHDAKGLLEALRRR